jgi:pimeloyl-ACP methyl ester carboxylesterase
LPGNEVAPSQRQPATFYLAQFSPPKWTSLKPATAIERARRQLALGRIVILGHSGHVLMALEYAKKFPAIVSHVVMIGITPDLSAASTAAAERY